MTSFASRPLEERIAERVRIMQKRSDYTPIVVSRGCRTAPRIDKTQYMVPNTLTVAQFSYVLRRRMRLAPEKTLYLMCSRQLLDANKGMYEVYAKYKDVDDGFLYISYAVESAFG